MTSQETPATTYPAYWYSGGKGQAWSVWNEGVLLSKHRSEADARARVTALESAFTGAADTALAEQP